MFWEESLIITAPVDSEGVILCFKNLVISHWPSIAVGSLAAVSESFCIDFSYSCWTTKKNKDWKVGLAALVCWVVSMYQWLYYVHILKFWMRKQAGMGQITCTKLCNWLSDKVRIWINIILPPSPCFLHYIVLRYQSVVYVFNTWKKEITLVQKDIFLKASQVILVNISGYHHCLKGVYLIFVL